MQVFVLKRFWNALMASAATLGFGTLSSFTPAPIVLNTAMHAIILGRVSRDTRALSQVPLIAHLPRHIHELQDVGR